MAKKRKGKRVQKKNSIQKNSIRQRGIRANKRNQKLKKQRAKKLILAAIAGVILVIIASYISMCVKVNKVDDKKICDNVFVGETDLSGLTSKKAKAVLEKHFAADSEIVVTMKAEDKKAEATLSELGIAPKDINALVKEAMDYGKTGSVSKRNRQLKGLQKEAHVIEEVFKIDETVATDILNERIDSLENGAVDASLKKTDAGLEVIEGKEGKIVNIEKSLDLIIEHLNSDWNHKKFEVEMVLEVGKPAITADDLNEVKDVLGEFSTDAGGGDRWQNLKVGSDMLNGKILMPGEEISVYNSTAPYDAEHGYVQAGTYENGEIVADWGGGICQVSTTLYNAVIFAELEIIERYPHSMTVSYVEPSRDAAIAGGIMDFRFKNSYDTPIYIFSEIDDENQLRFIIYGKETRPENRTIEFESETVSIEEYKVTYKENPDMSVGEMEYTGNPHSGRDACLWKIVYEDGVEVSREKFNTSYYMKVDEVIEVGTKGAGGALGAIQSAIGSQDYDKIIAAINSVE